MSKAETKKKNLLAVPDLTPKKNKDDSSQASQAEGASVKKRRGRKRERDDVYFVKGNAKIEGLKSQLKTDGVNLPLAERQKLRNQISAQKARLKKKEETIFLNKVVREKDDRYIKMVKGLCNIMSADQGQQLIDYLSKEWGVPKQTKGKNATNLYDYMSEHFVTKQEDLDNF